MLGLTAVGLMLIYSTTTDMGYHMYDDAAHFFKRQLQWMGIGLVGMFIASRLSYQLLTKVSIPIMVGALLMLAGLVLFREGRLLFGQSVSPVEIAKLAMIIYIAHWLSSKEGLLGTLPYGLLPFTIMVGVITGLVMAQPDISEALLIILVSVAMFFLAGADVVQFAIGIVGGGAAFAFVVTQFPHAMERLTPYIQEFRDPLHSANWQLSQGLVALGSGGLLGLGPGSGRMKYQWLPAAHTDSIFAIAGEELGLIGCLLIIGLLCVVAYRGIRIANQAPDSFGRLLALGITCWFTFQALMNMGAVTGTIPFTGIALPFISLGGSSLVSCMMGVGILLSISRACVDEAPADWSHAPAAEQGELA
ncbi:MAG TPA: putative peptidoglycan glycosyltransferase FtsW [Anaerolineae bacterium]|nr:putative peptidoglycan glycosyltransferase FtsW [Anaerolineae bacterium]